MLLSIISLLNEPNTFSPANVDASVMYRRWRESKDQEEYATIIRWGKCDQSVKPFFVHALCLMTDQFIAVISFGSIVVITLKGIRCFVLPLNIDIWFVFTIHLELCDYLLSHTVLHPKPYNLEIRRTGVHFVNCCWSVYFDPFTHMESVGQYDKGCLQLILLVLKSII